MRFLDEKQMWYSETKALSQRLANKSEIEIQEILDKHDVICLRSTERPKVNVLGRVLIPFVWLITLLICFFKWLVTGNGYLDTTIKKYKFLNYIFRYTGLRE